jgi:predicted O-methyltransferase YrrM
MKLYESLKNLCSSRPDQLLYLLGIGFVVVALAALWIDLRLGIAVVVLFSAGSYALNIVLATKQNGSLWKSFRQLEAFQQLFYFVSPRLPLPPTRLGAASPDLLLLLCKEILSTKPRFVVECGAGISTLVMGYLLEKNGQGQMVTLEHDPVWAERVARWVTEHQLDAHVQVVYAPIVEQSVAGKSYTWYDAATFKPLLATHEVDMLFIDGPPDYVHPDSRFPALAFLRPRFSPCCVIVMDDTERQDEAKAARIWAEELDYHLDLLVHLEKGAGVLRPRFTATIQEQPTP